MSVPQGDPGAEQPAVQQEAAAGPESSTKLPEARRTTGTTSPVRGRVQTIHYELSYLTLERDSGGDGAIVLLHDLPGGAFAWAEMMPQLAATGRSVYAFDMLGYGESDHPWPSDTSIWGQADCLSYAFSALKLTNVVLAGIGLGGAVAQVLATRLYREQVRSLVLLGSYAYQYAFCV